MKEEPPMTDRRPPGFVRFLIVAGILLGTFGTIYLLRRDDPRGASQQVDLKDRPAGGSREPASQSGPAGSAESGDRIRGF